MTTWLSLLAKQKTYEITKLLPETKYTVSINGNYNEPVEVWLTTLNVDENEIIETEVNQDNAVYVGNLENNKLTFTAQESHTALVVRPLGYLEINTIQLEKGDVATDWTPAPEDFNNLKGKSYTLSQPLQKENTLSLNGSFEEDDFIGLWLGNDKFIGFLDNQKLTFDLTENYDDEFVVIKTLSEKGIIDNAKLEKGSIATEWSPNPQDGYGYNGANPSYHIQTTGGTETIKLFRQKAYPVDEVVETSVKVKAFNTVRLSDNYLVQVVNPNEYVDWSVQRVSNGVNNIGLQFRTIEIADEIDFVACDASVYAGTRLDAINMLEIIKLSEHDDRKEIVLLPSNEVLEDTVISVKYKNTGSIYARNMKEIEIELYGNYDLLGTWVKFNRFISSPQVENGKEYKIDYGSFGVVKQDYDVGTNRTTLIAYDNMIKAQIPYDSDKMNLTYPTTELALITRMCTLLELDLQIDSTRSLANVVSIDLWSNQSFTYADIFGHIAQSSGTIISIKNDKLTVYDAEVYDFNIEGKFFKLNFSDPYGKTNIINITQEPQHENTYYPLSALDIPLQDRKELVYDSNPILEQNRQYNAERVYNLVKDLEYDTFESNGLGYGIFDIGDIVNVYDNSQEIYRKCLITSEEFTFKGQLVTDLSSKKPFVYQGNYVVETDQKRVGQRTFIEVDKLNAVITLLSGRVDEVEDTTASLVIQVDEITSKVESLSNMNLVKNLNLLTDFDEEDKDYDNWTSQSSGWFAQVGMFPLEYEYNRYTLGNQFFMYGEDNSYSLSGRATVILKQGSAETTDFTFISPDTEYSMRFKVLEGDGSWVKVEVIEFDEDEVELKRNVVNSTAILYPAMTFTSTATTKYIKVAISTQIDTNLLVANPVKLCEFMFNRGIPRVYALGANEVYDYASSEIKQTKDEIALTVKKDDVISSINQSAEQIAINANRIKLEGYTTINDHFQVLQNGDVKMVNADVSGKITATSGSIGGFDIEGNTLSGQDVEISPYLIQIGDSELGKTNIDNNEALKIKAYYLELGDETRTGNWLRLGGRQLVQGFTQTSNWGYTLFIRNIQPASATGLSRDIGTSSNRFNNIYLSSQPNVSSDSRIKENIQAIDQLLIDKFMKLEAKQYNLKITKDLINFGYIAQDVQEILHEYVSETQGEEVAEEFIKQYALLHNDESFLSLLYNEINVIIAEGYRRKTIELEARLEELERKQL